MTGRLAGKRALVTQAEDFMGPAVVELFRREGATVMPATRDLTAPDSALTTVAEAGHVDILVANLMRRNSRKSLVDTADDEWAAQFDAMVHPLHRLVRAVAPQMIGRRAGKIVVMGSANGLRGSMPRAAYSAARGAQLAYVKAAGVELAPHNVQINAIAQNYVQNPSSYPPAETTRPEFAARLAEVPIGRLARGEESAALALFLAGPESDFFIGQIVPFSGGWAG